MNYLFLVTFGRLSCIKRICLRVASTLRFCSTELDSSPATQARSRARERKRLRRRARSRARLVPEIFRDVTPKMFASHEHSGFKYGASHSPTTQHFPHLSTVFQSEPNSNFFLSLPSGLPVVQFSFAATGPGAEYPASV